MKGILIVIHPHIKSTTRSKKCQDTSYSMRETYEHKDPIMCFRCLIIAYGRRINSFFREWVYSLFISENIYDKKGHSLSLYVFMVVGY